MSKNLWRTRIAAFAMLVAAVTGSTIAAPAAFASTTVAPTPGIAQSPDSVFGSNNIGGGWRMYNNGSVYSPDGTTRLTLLRGLLEVWVDGNHVWTASQSAGGDYVDFQHDGNLVVYQNNGHAVWASNTSGWCGPDGCHLAIENGGNVAVEDDVDYWNYWETNTDR
ncbi:hypothetical protein [Amycolatopsis sp. NPDC051061]|uniref:hypothetical protein n=1 Tax=Amycolatopsis sp. NPDC051061 TaxID=3155042 RepID=UPI00344AE9BE